MNFPVVIHKDKNSDFGVTVPDLPGCFSAGETFELALENGKEAILCHVEGLIKDKESIPKATSIDRLKSKKEYKGGVWALVSVDLSELSKKAKRINVTVPENILRQIDYYAKRHGETRSGLFTNAALEFMSNHQP
jgi:predicted RNase H-like HicB family nuclease